MAEGNYIINDYSSRDDSWLNEVTERYIIVSESPMDYGKLPKLPQVINKLALKGYKPVCMTAYDCYVHVIMVKE
ncbi:MAG: hypothetical protein ABSG57_10860 [Candidatus Bathyarchaeia archaeon]|jgi:hypothetical protein